MKPENVNSPENLSEYGLLPKPAALQDLPAHAEKNSLSAESPAPASGPVKTAEPVSVAAAARHKSITIL
ncbi:hypothetical protein KK083_17855 [Fulvivirgaceae bacterium PWU4]|uniref:Uncharacterized protein n=1 Tax=Chryseosolibacter histidini TaxID=2782349 RepID=A0AAP2DPC5_9BACT|nr:hypothetical protein [Chryseosolibacter histidini]MBT1698762.1 hypothetical protein [Chryseosolibacter histidini]